MSIQVVTVTSRIPGPAEPYYRYGLFVESLKRFGVEPVVLGMGEPWFGLMTKPKRMRDWLRGYTDELVIWTDSFDVVFAAHPDEVAARYLKLWPSMPVLYNAERGIWPRADLADRFPECGTPWRYLNCGLMIGPPKDMLKVLDWMDLDGMPGDCLDPLRPGHKCEPNDQAWHQMAWSAKPTAMAIDTQCEIFQSCSACSMDDFNMAGGIISNRLTGTTPMIFHCNGGSKNDLLPAFLNVWGLE